MPSSTSSFRRFVVTFVLCSSIIGGVGLAGTEYLVRTHIAPNHNKYAYLELFKRAPVDGAVFGDSMMEGGYVGKANMLNLAQDGEAFFSMEKRIRLYVDMHQPKRLIIQAGVHHFAPSWSTNGKSDISGFKEALNENFSPLLMSMHAFHRHEIFLYWKKWLEGSEFISTRALGAFGGVTNLEDYSKENAEQKAIALRQEANYWSGIPVPDTSAVGAGLIDLLDYLNGRNIELCLVTLPVVKPMQELLRERPRVAEVINFFKNTADAHHAQYVNYINLDLAEDYFADQWHLNQKGARVFTDLVDRSCFNGAMSN